MTANFKKRMLTDYNVWHTTSESDEVYDASSQAASTSETPLKRLRLTARTLHFDIRDLGDIAQARSAVADLRLQTEVG
jgi:hypothetical protein